MIQILVEYKFHMYSEKWLKESWLNIISKYKHFILDEWNNSKDYQKRIIIDTKIIWNHCKFKKILRNYKSHT